MTRDETREKGAKEGKMTNGDKIRAMSDEELAKEMLFFCPSVSKPYYTGLDGRYYKDVEKAIVAALSWLNQEAE